MRLVVVVGWRGSGGGLRQAGKGLRVGVRVLSSRLGWGWTAFCFGKNTNGFAVARPSVSIRSLLPTIRTHLLFLLHPPPKKPPPSGYAADGYARTCGVGAVVVTFTVGGLSVINAIGGAYAEDVPVVCITGAPNSNDIYSNRIMHHTLAVPGSMQQELDCMRQVTCAQAVITRLEDAHAQIDAVLSAVVHNSKPGYIAVCSNLGALHHPSFDASPIPYRCARAWGVGGFGWEGRKVVVGGGREGGTGRGIWEWTGVGAINSLCALCGGHVDCEVVHAACCWHCSLDQLPLFRSTHCIIQKHIPPLHPPK